MSEYKTIDLNGDVGEGFGPYSIGRDRELIPLLSSANVACGFHAGDPRTMRETVERCVEAGVAVGAHPGGVADAASGTSASGGTSPAAGTDRSDQLSDADAAPDQPDAAGGEAAPSGGETAPSGGETAPPGSPGFDINRATAAEWDELPGIGPSKAQAIVEDRERNGPFRSIDDLARVKGIGPKLLERLREAIKERQNAGGG